MWQHRSGSVSQSRSGALTGWKDLNCSPYFSTSRSRVAYVSGKRTSVSSSTIGSSSSLSMCTSTDDCRCHEQVRHMRSPNSPCAQSSTSSALMGSTSGGRSAGVLAKQHLLQGVATQPEPEGLERDDFLGRDVAEVDVGAELLHEPGLRRLRRRLEDEVVNGNVVDDLVDEPGAHLAGRAVDPGRTAFAAFGDHFPSAPVELFLDPLHPEVRRVVDVRVLRADLRENGEVLCKLRDQLELALARDLERAVGDLDMREALIREPALELIELPPRVDGLEERAAAHDRRVERAVERDLLLEVVRDVPGAPAELDDVHVLPGGVEEALDLAQIQSLVD